MVGSLLTPNTADNAALQAVVILVGGLIYFPFFKKVDAMAYADEVKA
ncbi:hypothetical protein [uncultured Clostridium sp.]|nr:hypothetical protein [uncultured Clostridium sp.]